MKIYKFLWPFTAYCVQKCTNWQNFDSEIRRDHQKISYERRGREKKLISTMKNYEKKNSVVKENLHISLTLNFLLRTKVQIDKIL